MRNCVRPVGMKFIRSLIRYAGWQQRSTSCCLVVQFKDKSPFCIDHMRTWKSSQGLSPLPWLICYCYTKYSHWNKSVRVSRSHGPCRVWIWVNTVMQTWSLSMSLTRLVDRSVRWFNYFCSLFSLSKLQTMIAFTFLNRTCRTSPTEWVECVKLKTWAFIGYLDAHSTLSVMLSAKLVATGFGRSVHNHIPNTFQSLMGAASHCNLWRNIHLDAYTGWLESSSQQWISGNMTVYQGFTLMVHGIFFPSNGFGSVRISLLMEYKSSNPTTCPVTTKTTNQEQTMLLY